MIFTNNAAPLNNMFTVDRVSPFRLPWLFHYLGDIRFEGFIGHMTGLEFQTTLNTGATAIAFLGQYGKNLHPQPFLSGGKITFKLTPNFEFGMSKTTVYGGPGNPLTVKTFLDSTFGVHVNGQDVLGDGRTSADFSYRVPGLRNWLTAYGGSLERRRDFTHSVSAEICLPGRAVLCKITWSSETGLETRGRIHEPHCLLWYLHLLQRLNTIADTTMMVA